MWTLRQLAVALALVLSTSCTSTESPDEVRVAAPDLPPQNDAPPPAWGSPFVATERLGEGRPEHEVRGCAQDSDCVLSCVVDGDCCAERCGCKQVYNRHFLNAIEAHQRALCGDPECPEVKCAVSGGDPVVQCQAGLCRQSQAS